MPVGSSTATATAGPAAKARRNYSFLGGVPAICNYTRASASGLYMPNSGVMTTTTTNVPAVEFGNQHKNLVRNTDPASWNVPTRSTLNLAVGLQPDGTNTAAAIIPDTSNNSHAEAWSGIANGIVPGAQVYSAIDVKAAGYNFAYLIMTNPAMTNTIGAVFNANTGVISSVVQAGGAATSINAGLIDRGNGWWRIWVSGVLDLVATQANIWLYVQSTNSRAGAYAGDGVSGVWLANPQTDFGSTPNNYLPNSAAGGAIIADTLKGTRFSPVGFNQVANAQGVNCTPGTPGSMPNGWQYDPSPSGLTRQIVGTGTEDGIPYVEVRTFGTATGNGNCNFYCHNGAVAASPSQAWCNSVFVRRTAGSWANLTNPLLCGGDNTGNQVKSVPFPSTAPLVQQRIAFPFTTGAGAVTLLALTSLFQLTFLNGAVIDFTIRIGGSKVEQNNGPTIPWITTSLAAGNALDRCLIPIANVGGWWNSSATVGFAAVLECDGDYNDNSYWLSLGPAGFVGSLYVHSASSGSVVGLGSAIAGGGSTGSLAMPTPGTIMKMGISAISGGALRFALNGLGATAGGTGTITDPATNIGVFCANWSAGNGASGHVRNLKLINRALSQAELNAATS